MSYSEPPPPPPQYGAPQPPYGAPQPQKTNGMAVASLVLGILGIIPCASCLVLGILAIIFGRIGRRQIEESNGAQKGLGMAKAGFICGIVGVVLGVIYWIAVVATGNVTWTTDT